MSCCRFLLVLICCSTSLKPTNCWVNWLVSCVVSSVRKVLKFEVKSGTPVSVLVVVAGGVTLTPVVVVMASFLYLYVESAAVLALSANQRRGGGEIRRRACARRERGRRVLREALTIAAQIEAEAAAVGVEPGIAQRLLELARILLQEIERVGAVGGNHRGQPAVMVDVELDVDGSKARRLQLDLDLVIAGRQRLPEVDRDLLARRKGDERWAQACIARRRQRGRGASRRIGLRQRQARGRGARRVAAGIRIGFRAVAGGWGGVNRRAGVVEGRREGARVARRIGAARRGRRGDAGRRIGAEAEARIVVALAVAGARGRR